MRASSETSIGWAAAPLVWAIFPVLHLSHGLGFASGLLRFTRHPDRNATEQLERREGGEDGRVAPAQNLD